MNAANILAENARYIQTEHLRASQLCDGLLKETADACLASGTDPVQMYKSVMGEDVCTPAFAKYCEYICANDHKATIGNFLPEGVEIGSMPDVASISYQQNQHSDRAYCRFADGMKGAQPVVHPTTAAVCEEVHYGRCSHCILPIYSSQDGIFTAFTKLMNKYDLVINAACDVTMPDGDSVMRFALLRRELALPDSDVCYVQFNAVLPETISLASLLTACEAIGAHTAEMITSPLAYTMDHISYTIRLKIARSTLSALLMLLHTVLDNYSLEGIFSITQ